MFVGVDAGVNGSGSAMVVASLTGIDLILRVDDAELPEDEVATVLTVEPGWNDACATPDAAPGGVDWPVASATVEPVELIGEVKP